jgi:hypothetical protein
VDAAAAVDADAAVTRRQVAGLRLVVRRAAAQRVAAGRPEEARRRRAAAQAPGPVEAVERGRLGQTRPRQSGTR